MSQILDSGDRISSVYARVKIMAKVILMTRNSLKRRERRHFSNNGEGSSVLGKSTKLNVPLKKKKKNLSVGKPQKLDLVISFHRFISSILFSFYSYLKLTLEFARGHCLSQ